MVKMCIESKSLENGNHLSNNQVEEQHNGVDLDMEIEDDIETVEDNLKVRKLAGGSLISHAPILNPNEK